MAESRLKTYTVTVKQHITLPHRTKPERVDPRYTLSAKTEKGAIKAVRDAGIKGKIVKVELIRLKSGLRHE